MAQKILGIVGWIGIATVMAGMVARFVIPEQIEVWWWAMVGGLGLVAVYMLGQWRSVLELFSRRQARYGTLATTSVLLGMAVLVGANWVLARQNKRWDLTAAQQYSLSDQTVRILESLESPIRVLVFDTEGGFQRFRDRLAEYEYISDDVSLEFIDIDRDPVLARQYEVQSYGTVVFDYNGRIERVVSDQEQDLTNALIKAVEGEERKVYFLTGHGERNPTDTEQRTGYSSLSDALRRDNLSVETLNLVEAGEVPSDTAAVVAAGGTNDLLPAEIDLLRTYLDGGGSLLALIDPPEGSETPDRENLVSFMGEWGIEVGRDVVVDISGVGQLLGTDATVPVVASYPQHAITDRFALLTAFPLSRSVRPGGGGDGDRMPESFLETTARSWAESDLDLTGGEVAMDEEQGDVPGPIPIGVAVSVEAANPMEPTETDEGDETAATETGDDGPPETRLVVIGDSDFASNGFLGIQGNSDLALNVVNWLTQQENLIAIRPREPEDRRITLTADQQFRIVMLSLLVIPGVIVGSGVYVWWRRR